MKVLIALAIVILFGARTEEQSILTKDATVGKLDYWPTWSFNERALIGGGFRSIWHTTGTMHTENLVELSIVLPEAK